MSGWDGAGNFVLPYSMVAEAAAGVKILSSHQDTQWTAIQAGLQNCQTRDGQNSPSADINWANHKITNVALIQATAIQCGAYDRPIRTVNVATVLIATDSVVLVDTTAAGILITLPLASVAGAGFSRRLTIINITNLHNVTVVPQVGDVFQAGTDFFNIGAHDYVSNGVHDWWGVAS